MDIDERLKNTEIPTNLFSKIRNMYESLAKKHQRKKRRKILLFLSCYACLKQDGKEMTLKNLSEQLNFGHSIITDAVKYNREYECCKIEEVDLSVIIEATLSKFRLENIDIKSIEDQYNSIAFKSDICNISKPSNVINAIIYRILSEDFKFNKIYFTDKVDMSVVTLDKILNRINLIFEN